ncbi:MAG: FtsQ-type POTRA domain-containing protein, partial [Actinomycetota bacterium]
MTTTRPVRRPAPAPSGTAARFAARARAARWRHRRPLAVAVVVAVLLVAVAGFLYAGPVLVVREVTVAGVGAARAEQVRAAAAAPLQQPLARVDTGAVAERVRALPFAEVVTVRR